MIDRLTLDTFVPLVGQKFGVKSGEGDSIELELIEAVAIPAHGDAPRKDPFSLVFREAGASTLWQGSVRLEDERVGSVDLFLVPVGEDPEGRYFEALFN